MQAFSGHLKVQNYKIIVVVYTQLAFFLERKLANLHLPDRGTSLQFEVRFNVWFSSVEHFICIAVVSARAGAAIHGAACPLHLLVLSRSVPLSNHRVLQWPVGNVPGSVPLRA